jgi:thiamine biosynthesis lipoprotein
MGTWFEARLLGDDPQHLADVAEAVLDEVERIDRLLSRFDPRSEIARINAEAARRAVRVDFEVLGILETCRAAWQETRGCFDVAARSGSFGAVAIDPSRRTVRFREPGLALDLGGIGKGYALDRGAAILATHGVRSAFLHGGTSSILAVGHDATGQPWTVGVRDPFVPAGEAAELFRVRVAGRGFSCSATHSAGQAVSDLFDPRSHRPVEAQAACVVLAADATGAEVLSTALLCMGKEEAAEQALRYAGATGFDLAWIECRDDRPTWSWLTPWSTPSAPNPSSPIVAPSSGPRPPA